MALLSDELAIQILSELRLIRTQLDILAKLRSRDRVTGQELRRARERIAKLKAERDIARKMFASLDPDRFEFVKNKKFNHSSK